MICTNKKIKKLWNETGSKPGKYFQQVYKSSAVVKWTSESLYSPSSSSYIIIIIIKWVVKWKRRMPSVCGICPGQMFTCQVQCKWGQGLLVFCISICILYLQLYFCILYQRYPSTLIAIWCNIHLRWVFHVFICWSRQLFPISMKMHRKWWRCLLGCQKSELSPSRRNIQECVNASTLLSIPQNVSWLVGWLVGVLETITIQPKLGKQYLL